MSRSSVARAAASRRFTATPDGHLHRSSPTARHRCEDAFQGAIAAAGLGSPEIIADGVLHRFRCDGDKPGSFNGWYVLHLDGTPAGKFGSWRTGFERTWCATNPDTLSSEERARLRAQNEQRRRQRLAEQQQRYTQAAARARRLWASAAPADPRHRYLVKKAIAPHGARQLGDTLLIPVIVDGQLASLQHIAPDGSKRFLPGGRIQAGYALIPGQTRREELLICEGFATGATLHEHLRAAVYVAFTAGNLTAVARAVRRLHPQAKIIIAGDDDQWTPRNPGATAARDAALAINAKVLLPDFSGLDLSTRPTDFNDLARLSRAARRSAA
jgi:putative DNA primase/helicase